MKKLLPKIWHNFDFLSVAKPIEPNDDIQSNLPVEDMLYSTHLVIVETYSWNWSKDSIADIFTVDTVFWYPVKSSSQIYLFTADTPYFLGENKYKLLFDFQIFLFDIFI